MLKYHDGAKTLFVLYEIYKFSIIYSDKTNFILNY